MKAKLINKSPDELIPYVNNAKVLHKEQTDQIAASKYVFTCKCCGKKGVDYKSNRKNNKDRQFCSVSCRSNFANITKSCCFCGGKFRLLKSSMGPTTNASGKYCSRICYNNHLGTMTGKANKSYKRVGRSCGFCGKSVEIIPSRIKRTKDSYCGSECRSKAHTGKYAGNKNPTWKGGHIKRKGDFATAKTLYFKGKKAKCYMCGTSEKIHIHHVIPYRYTKDNSYENLVPLCSNHHRKVEVITWDFIDQMNHDYELCKPLLIGLLEKQRDINSGVLSYG